MHKSIVALLFTVIFILVYAIKICNVNSKVGIKVVDKFEKSLLLLILTHIIANT